MKKSDVGRPTKEKMEMLEIRKRIAQKLIDSGKTHQWVADFLGIHRSNISRLVKKDEKENQQH